MSRNKNYTVPEQFESIFKIVSSPRFLNKEGLGGNRAVFIHPYPISKQVDFELHYNFLLKRLEQNNTAILSIDLYKICISILESKGILFKIFEFEQSKPKHELKRDIRGSLDIAKIILPAIKNLMESREHKVILIHGLDKIFPYLSLVSILVNIQTILNNEPVVFFYPGEYDNFSLNLFERINEDNEYRAFNLNNYN